MPLPDEVEEKNVEVSRLDSRKKVLFIGSGEDGLSRSVTML